MVDTKEKESRIHKVLSQLQFLHKELEKNILEKDNGKSDYLDFLQDVSDFIEWTNMKYDFRYNGNNNRSVKRGEIYYCNLGENVGSEQSKNRPVIILQNDTGNQFGPTTIVAPITNTHKKLPVHVPIKEIKEDAETTGVIRLEHMREISKCRLGVYIEKIDTNSTGWKKVVNAVKKSLDIR